MINYSLDFEYARGKPTARAWFRVEPEDFCVQELLGFTPCGEGEHVYLHIRKRNQNTLWVARQLARYCKVRELDVGYCGLKDRRAVTDQWFSIYLPKAPQINWSAFSLPEVEILDGSRHTHKLKPGVHQANHFAIRLRDCVGELGDTQAVAEGVPNYFGEQRFGIEVGNLTRAQALLVERRTIKDRKQRGLIISAARAYLFNSVLSARVARGDWRRCLPGDVDTEPTGPLWGRGRSLVSAATAELEQSVLGQWREWCEGLEHVGLQQERRPLVCRPLGFGALQEGADLRLRFDLPPGQYATSVLREIAGLH